MKKSVLAGATIFLSILGFFIITTFTAFPRAPMGIHTWLPLPVACAGYACVTYSQWHRALSQSETNTSQEEVLTILLEEKAFSVIAEIRGVFVSTDEVHQAIESANIALQQEKRSFEVNNGHIFNTMKQLLLREKLIAQGVISPFDNEAVLPITVWNVHITWNENLRRIESTSPLWQRVIAERR